nr:uncharacterized protein LOC127333694 [Lolium perenne]
MAAPLRPPLSRHAPASAAPPGRPRLAPLPVALASPGSRHGRAASAASPRFAGPAALTPPRPGRPRLASAPLPTTPPSLPLRPWLRRLASPRSGSLRLASLRPELAPLRPLSPRPGGARPAPLGCSSPAKRGLLDLL